MRRFKRVGTYVYLWPVRVDVLVKITRLAAITPSIKKERRRELVLEISAFQENL